MAYEQRQMHQGSWSCSKCGSEITELPFEPDPSRVGQLKCRDCHRQSKNNSYGHKRQMHQGSWSCSKCGSEITELPFEPDPSRVGQLKCRDCHRQDRF